MATAKVDQRMLEGMKVGSPGYSDRILMRPKITHEADRRWRDYLPDAFEFFSKKPFIYAAYKLVEIDERDIPEGQTYIDKTNAFKAIAGSVLPLPMGHDSDLNLQIHGPIFECSKKNPFPFSVVASGDRLIGNDEQFIHVAAIFGTEDLDSHDTWMRPADLKDWDSRFKYVSRISGRLGAFPYAIATSYSERAGDKNRINTVVFHWGSHPEIANRVLESYLFEIKSEYPIRSEGSAFFASLFKCSLLKQGLQYEDPNDSDPIFRPIIFKPVGMSGILNLRSMYAE